MDYLIKTLDPTELDTVLFHNFKRLGLKTAVTTGKLRLSRESYRPREQAIKPKEVDVTGGKWRSKTLFDLMHEKLLSRLQ